MNRPPRTSPLKAAAIQHLEDLARAGVTHLPLAAAARRDIPPPSAIEAAATRATHAPPCTPLNDATMATVTTGMSRVAVPASAAATGPSTEPTAMLQEIASRTANPGPALALADRHAALEQVRRDVAACTRCAELAQTRTQTVFGVGNPGARLCFLGEAPGADEDAQGEPFVGRAGQLLTRIIEACTLQRSEVYILNILKCRPPGNRNPLPQEADSCRGFLNRQFDIIRPEFICCLGAVAAKNLLGTEETISKLRGKFFRYGEAEVLCTYHPAYLLRNPPAKRQVWEDMQLLLARMGIELPAQGEKV